jgi:hypothetical protein
MDKFDELREKIVPLLLPYGVKRIALFGSVARGEETPESDIDILVEFEEQRLKPLGLLSWVRLEEQIAASVHRNVDLLSALGLSRHVRPYVEKDVVVLYEKA